MTIPRAIARGPWMRIDINQPESEEDNIDEGTSGQYEVGETEN